MIHHRVTYTIGGRLREYHSVLARRYDLPDGVIRRIVAKEHHKLYGDPVEVRDVSLLLVRSGPPMRDER